MTLNSSEKNAFTAVSSLLKIAKVNVTAKTLKNKLLQHSDFPTLVSLSDVLIDLRVDNLATRINPHQLSEIPLPAIVHFENGTGYATLIKVEDNHVEWIHDQIGFRRESIAEFSQKWSGITLLAQPNEISGEDNYSKNRRIDIVNNLRNPFIISGLLLTLLYCIWAQSANEIIENQNVFYALLVAKFAGLIVSSLLIWYSIDANTPLLRRVCEINSKTSCSNILHSEVAIVWGWLTWAEIGLFYFTGGFLGILFAHDLSQTLIVLKWLNLLALPYTVWSVYYQGFVAKQWCVLCLTVLLLLWVEFFTLSQIPMIPNTEITLCLISLCFCFLSVTVLWAFIKKPLQNAQRFDIVNNTLQKIKFDHNYVEAIFNNHITLPPIFDGMSVIEFANKEANINLTIVLSPFCSICKDTYWSVKNIVKQNPQFKCTILLVSQNTPQNIAKFILGLSKKQIIPAMDEWFENPNPNIVRWRGAFEQYFSLNEGEKQFELHRNWASIANISSTPTIFFNDIEIPSIYNTEDIEKLYRIVRHTLGFANQP